jgi:hypothetical protein
MNQNTTVEVWKDIKGLEGLYQVSNMGRVKSLERIETQKNGRKVKRKEIILKNGFSGPKGKQYHSVNFRRSDKSMKVHRLVAEAFLFRESKDLVVDHINRDKLDNRAENLEWVTVLENCRRQRHTRGSERSGILLESDVKHIRHEYHKLCEQGKKRGALTVISKGYKVNKVTIFDIVKKRTWQHI